MNIKIKELENIIKEEIADAVKQTSFLKLDEQPVEVPVDPDPGPQSGGDRPEEPQNVDQLVVSYRNDLKELIDSEYAGIARLIKDIEEFEIDGVRPVEEFIEAANWFFNQDWKNLTDLLLAFLGDTGNNQWVAMLTLFNALRGDNTQRANAMRQFDKLGLAAQDSQGKTQKLFNNITQWPANFMNYFDKLFSELRNYVRVPPISNKVTITKVIDIVDDDSPRVNKRREKAGLPPRKAYVRGRITIIDNFDTKAKKSRPIAVWQPAAQVIDNNFVQHPPQVIGGFAYSGHGVPALQKPNSKEFKNFLDEVHAVTKDITSNSNSDADVIAALRRQQKALSGVLGKFERPIVEPATNGSHNTDWLEKLIKSLPPGIQNQIDLGPQRSPRRRRPPVAELSPGGLVLQTKDILPIGNYTPTKIIVKDDNLIEALAKANQEIEKSGALRPEWRPPSLAPQTAVSRAKGKFAKAWDAMQGLGSKMWGVKGGIDDINSADQFFTSRNTSDVRVLKDWIEDIPNLNDEHKQALRVLSGEDLTFLNAKEAIARTRGVAPGPRPGILAALRNKPWSRLEASRLDYISVEEYIESLNKIKSSLRGTEGYEDVKKLKFLTRKGIGTQIDLLLRDMERQGKYLDASSCRDRWKKILDKAKKEGADSGTIENALEQGGKIFDKLEQTHDYGIIMKLWGKLLRLFSSLAKVLGKIFGSIAASLIFFVSDVNQVASSKFLENKNYGASGNFGVALFLGFLMTIDVTGIIGHSIGAESYVNTGFIGLVQKKWWYVSIHGLPDMSAYGLNKDNQIHIKIYKKIKEAFNLTVSAEVAARSPMTPEQPGILTIKDKVRNYYTGQGWDEYDAGDLEPSFFRGIPSMAQQKEFHTNITAQLARAIETPLENQNNIEFIKKVLKPCYNDDPTEYPTDADINKSVEAAKKIAGFLRIRFARSKSEPLTDLDLGIKAFSAYVTDEKNPNGSFMRTGWYENPNKAIPQMKRFPVKLIPKKADGKFKFPMGTSPIEKRWARAFYCEMIIDALNTLEKCRSKALNDIKKLEDEHGPAIDAIRALFSVNSNTIAIFIVESLKKYSKESPSLTIKDIGAKKLIFMPHNGFLARQAENMPTIKEAFSELMSRASDPKNFTEDEFFLKHLNKFEKIITDSQIEHYKRPIRMFKDAGLDAKKMRYEWQANYWFFFSKIGLDKSRLSKKNVENAKKNIEFINNLINKRIKPKK